MALGSGIRECYALSFRIAGRQSPECFGTIDDPQSQDAYRISLENRFKELEQRSTQIGLIIGKDLVYHDVPQGLKTEYSRLTFRIAAGSVYFGDGKDWFVRVVNYLAANTE